MKRYFLALAVSAALLGAAGTASAGTAVGQMTGGIGAFWTATDNERGLDNGISLNYSFGYALNDNWDVGLNLYSGNHDEKTQPWDTEIRGYFADFNRVFDRDARLTPFLTIGAGIIDQHRPGFGVADKEVAAKFGGGVLTDIADFGGGKLQLKLDGAMRTSIGRSITDFTVGLGLQMAFGGG